MISQNSPELSAIISTPDNYQTIRSTIQHLSAQTKKHKIEVVIVAPSEETLNLEVSDLEPFHRFQVVATGHLTTIAAANAAGIRHAGAPLVVICEDHSFPAPGWADALIEAHRRPWAAVGPVVNNANPKNLLSWADLFLAYGPWLDPAPAGVRKHLPGHNSCYKRDILLGYGSALASLLVSESVLHWDLGRKGYQLYLEPRAKVKHLNFSRSLSTWLHTKFLSGRVFAASRARTWSPLRRLVFACGTPVIPVIRFFRIWSEIPRTRRFYFLMLRAFPIVISGLTVSAVGEMAGYGVGDARGETVRKLSKYESHRVQHV